MMHIRKYNESIDTVILTDVKDICQELEDDGFYTYTAQINFKKPSFYVEIIKNIRVDEYFQYKDVKETVLRLRDYLDSNLKSISIFTHKRRWFKDCRINEDGIWGIYEGIVFFNPPILKIRIDFK